MQTQRLCEVFSNNRYTLYAVESIETTCNKSRTGGGWYGNIKPIAIIIDGPDGAYAMDIDARLIDTDKLKESIPALQNLL